MSSLLVLFIELLNSILTTKQNIWKFYTSLLLLMFLLKCAQSVNDIHKALRWVRETDIFNIGDFFLSID